MDRPGRVVALIKPQFEAGKKDAAKGEGVIRDPAIHRKVLLETLGFATDQRFSVQGLIRSPLLGPKGNTEFLVDLVCPANTEMVDCDAWVQKVLPAEAASQPGEAT